MNVCIQPGCVADAEPRGLPMPGAPFCRDHTWATYRVTAPTDPAPTAADAAEEESDG